MPLNGYSVGRDTTIVVILPDGTSLNLGTVTKFSSKQDTTTEKIKALDGKTYHLRYFDGWTGSFEVNRQGPDLDAYFSGLESDYYAGITEGYATIQQTISEPDGSVTQYRFDRCILQLDDAGDYASDKSVMQKVSFMATQRVQQA